MSARLGTYSIVARDPESGELGVAVQSHWFSVGTLVSWARAGVGAVATQSVAERSYGPRLLDRLAAGEAPGAALRAELDRDELARLRQVAVVANDGSVAAHTGDGCIAHAGHAEGEGFSVQANLMASERVWPLMAVGFADAGGSLAHRMMSAMRAAEAEGGDIRGRQSAAMLIVPGSGEAWETSIDLRVEDDDEPLVELERLLALHAAYALADEADELAGAGRHPEAGERYRRAAELAPGNHELLFWSGLAIAAAGDVAVGAERVRRAITLQPGWRRVLAELGDEIAPGADPVRRELAV